MTVLLEDMTILALISWAIMFYIITCLQAK